MQLLWSTNLPLDLHNALVLAFICLLALSSNYTSSLCAYSYHVQWIFLLVHQYDSTNKITRTIGVWWWTSGMFNLLTFIIRQFRSQINFWVARSFYLRILICFFILIWVVLTFYCRMLPIFFILTTIFICNLT